MTAFFLSNPSVPPTQSDKPYFCKGVVRLLMEIILCVAALLALAVSVFGCIKRDTKAMVAGQISGAVVLGICLLYIQLFLHG